jgi:Ca2+-binding RTX toxin-like protein
MSSVRNLVGTAAALIGACSLIAAASALAVDPTGVAQDPVAPTCAEGPERRGDVTVGTPCDDVIRVPPGVARVQGGGGDDTIVPTAITAAADCPSGCFLGVGSQTFEGGPGDDVVYGQRGNDKLFGGEGNDRLYGGIGDDLLRGGPGNDQLGGGHGFDVIDGESGDDLVHGDGTVDEILDSGGGTDTLSYATGVTPGFTRSTGISGFPAASGERGVYLDLATGVGDNGVATDGGGVDEVKVASGTFERVIGTPFSDYIAGGSAAETIEGGGGADALIGGGGGGDTLRGGADGDYLAPDAGDTLEPGPGDSGGAIGLRDGSKVSAGFEAPGQPGPADLYLVGSSAADDVTATYVPGAPDKVTLQLASAAGFDQTPPGCEAPAPGSLACSLPAPLDAIVVAGVGGNDTLRANGFPSSVAVMLLGGTGSDSLLGGDSEDVLADGPGDDDSEALGGDDAILNNEGLDELHGGAGNDLFLNDSLCDGDVVDGGADRDNSSWAKLKVPVEARLDTGVAGPPGSGGPNCSGGTLSQMQAIEDLEATEKADFLYGDGGNNQLLGRPGPDTYFALDGNDSILANSGDEDLAIDCGPGSLDSALIDKPPIVDPAPVGCEFVNQAPPESFEPPDLTPAVPGSTAPPPATKAPAPDRRAPGTRIAHRPPRVVITRSSRRTVVFSFAADEPGARFRCRLDRKPFAACRSPHSYKVGPGAHSFRVFAIDRAGNRDRSPAFFAFRVRRR